MNESTDGYLKKKKKTDGIRLIMSVGQRENPEFRRGIKPSCLRTFGFRKPSHRHSITSFLDQSQSETYKDHRDPDLLPILHRKYHNALLALPISR